MSQQDKFVSPCPLPTAHEREVLTVLIEEAAEVIHRATKLLRFGRDEIEPGQSLTNAERLSDEVGDFAALSIRVLELGLLMEPRCNQAMDAKMSKLDLYLQTSPTPRTQSDLVKAAKAVIDRWDTPNWKDAEPTGKFIGELRAAVRDVEQADA